MASTASSRIFVRGLPPTITEADFRKHFSAKEREITDIKLLPKRRIGYVGYKTPDEANAAVKYFNRTFIRMSRVEVEIAKSISDPSLKRVHEVKSEEAPKKAETVEKTEDKSKKRKRDVDESDPKLREYLRVMQSGALASTADGAVEEAPVLVDDDSGDEYEDLPAKKSRLDDKESEPQEVPKAQEPVQEQVPEEVQEIQKVQVSVPAPVAADVDDDEWLRARTSRVLDLVDADELDAARPTPAPAAPAKVPEVEMDDAPEVNEPKAHESVDNTPNDFTPPDIADQENTAPSARLFVRNLSYKVTEEDLRELFSSYGAVEEAHVAVGKDGSPKGFGFVQFVDASSADDARHALDGTPFQGRLIHILTAEAKREQGLDEFALAKLPLKKQNLIRKKAEAASKAFNWNSLYMSQDAVNASVAERLGVSKSDMLDPTSSDAAVKQALAETSIIQETKAYFAANGVDIDAFKSKKRGDNTILVKNFPHGTSTEELRTLFETHGTVVRVLMPPSGTIAIVHFAQPGQAKAAFAKLAYSRIRESVLFLEKGPAGLFAKDAAVVKAEAQVATQTGPTPGVYKVSVQELLERDQEEEEEQFETTTLFVRNLAFATTTAGLEDAFQPLDGFVSARVKTKTDPKRPGEVLSMGFGFAEFRTKEDAQAALKVMDGKVLDGHALGIKPSHRGNDAAEERRRDDRARKAAGKRTKIMIRNLPFEATKKDVRTLFGAYGQLRAVRVPRKFDKSRGFGFAEYTTPREAENALNALRDTHLLGRRLVLEYAEAEAADAEEEIEKMTHKIGGQAGRVALQQLMGGGRTRVTIDNGEADNEY